MGMGGDWSLGKGEKARCWGGDEMEQRNGEGRMGKTVGEYHCYVGWRN